MTLSCQNCRTIENLTTNLTSKPVINWNKIVLKWSELKSQYLTVQSQLVGCLLHQNSHLWETERSWGRSLPCASTICQLPRLSSVLLSDRLEGTNVNRFPWGRRIRGNVLRPAGSKKLQWGWRNSNNNILMVSFFTFVMVLTMQRNVVPARVSASLPCFPVIHVVFPVWKSKRWWIRKCATKSEFEWHRNWVFWANIGGNIQSASLIWHSNICKYWTRKDAQVLDFSFIYKKSTSQQKTISKTSVY